MDSPKRGRPPLLTPELIQEGKRLKRQQDQGKVIDPADQIKIDLVEAIDRAMANREIELAKAIRAASANQWQAAAWLLERTTPERWGDTRKELAMMKKRQKEMDAQLQAALKRRGLKVFPKEAK
jgi:hypothetical protein